MLSRYTIPDENLIVFGLRHDSILLNTLFATTKDLTLLFKPLTQRLRWRLCLYCGYANEHRNTIYSLEQYFHIVILAV